MIRFGLCCIFVDEPIKFRTATAKALSAFPRKTRMTRVSQICLQNAERLLDAVQTVERLGIKAFRILSQLFPRYTHPDVGYTMDELPDAGLVLAALNQVNKFCRSHDIRLSFHPDQFVVLNSPQEDVVVKSIAEIEYQASLAKVLGAEVINIHAGGAYGDKTESLRRFARHFNRLSECARARLTVENDDSLFTPADILPLCGDVGIPFVYDVHHHRCNPDGLSIENVTARATETWTLRRQEPLFHVSSPKFEWQGRNPKPHADYINIEDVPDAWRALDSITLDVEAKAKERAVLKLMAEWPRRSTRQS